MNNNDLGKKIQELEDKIDQALVYEKPVLNKKEVAILLGTSFQTLEANGVYDEIASFPLSKRKKLYRREVVLDYVKEREIKNGFAKHN